MAEKKIGIDLVLNTDKADKKVDKFKKDAAQGIDIPVNIDLSDIKNSLKAIEGLVKNMHGLFNKDVRFEGLQKGLDDIQKKINSITKINKNGEGFINVNAAGLKNVKDDVSKITNSISEMTSNIKSLNESKIKFESFDKLASVLKNIETILNSIKTGLNLETIRPSAMVQGDIERTLEDLDKLSKKEKEIAELEEYLNNRGSDIGKKIIGKGASEDVLGEVTGLQKLIKQMEQYIKLGGDLSDIKFKAKGIDDVARDWHSLLDVLDILTDENKINIIDSSKISDDVENVKKLRKELNDLNQELANAQIRENRDLNVSLDTKSIEEFASAIKEAVQAIGNLNFSIPEDFSFDGLSVESLEKIIGKLDEIVGNIKNISTLLSTGIDTSELRNIEVNVEPNVDTTEFIKKIEEKLNNAVVEVKAKINLEEQDDITKPELINNETITGIKTEFKNITDDFGFNLQTEISGIQENLKSVLGQIDYDNLFSSLRETLLDIVIQFQNSLQAVGLSSSQLDDAYKTIKGWNDADSYASNKANVTTGERGAFLNSKTGSISNSFIADSEGSFRNTLFKALKDLSVGVDGEISSIYDTWVHSHPFRKSIEGLKAIGSDVGFSVSDLEIGIEKLLKDKLPNMLLTQNYKFSNLDLSGVSEDITQRFIEEYRSELLKAGLEEATVEGKKKVVFPSSLAKHDGVYDLDKKSQILNDAMYRALSNVGLESSRLTTGNIEDLKVDLSSLQQEEQQTTQETQELLEIFRKLGTVLDGISGESFKLGISEESLNGIVSQLSEIVDLIKILNAEKLNRLDDDLNTNTSLTQTFDNDVQKDLVYLENYKNTIAEIDKLKLEPETDETIQKMKELNDLADYYVSQMSVIRSENGAYISSAGLKDSFGRFPSGLKSRYTNDQLEEFYNIGVEKYGTSTNLSVPEFKVIGDEIASIESKSDGLRTALSKNIIESKKYINDLKLDLNESNISNELGQLELLEKKVAVITTEVDNKTRAFQEEEQVVTGTVQREITSLELLDGQLIEIIDTIKRMNEIPIDLDLGILGDENFEDGKLSRLLTDLSEKVNSLNIESLSKLSESLQGLKINKTTVDNLEKVANLLKEFSTSIKGLSLSDNNFLSEINKLLSKSDELKSLSNILDKGQRKFKHAYDMMNESDNNADDSSNENVVNDKVVESIRRKKEELAACELQAEELRYDLDKLSDDNKNAKIGFASSNMSDKQLSHKYDIITDRIFKEYNPITGTDGSKKWMAQDNLANIDKTTLKSYQMWQEELSKVGYRLSEIRETSVGLEADIIPIDGKAITNAEEFRSTLSEIQTVADLVNSEIEELELRSANIRNEINSLEQESVAKDNAPAKKKKKSEKEEILSVRKAYQLLKDTKAEYIALDEKRKGNTATDDELEKLKQLELKRKQATSVVNADVIRQTADAMNKLKFSDSGDMFDNAFAKASQKIEEFNSKLREGEISLEEYNSVVSEIQKNLKGTKNSKVMDFIDVESLEEAKSLMKEIIKMESGGKADIFDSDFENSKKVTGTWTDHNGEVHKLTLSYDQLSNAMMRTYNVQQKIEKQSKSLSELFRQGWQNVKQYVMSFVGFYEVINAFRNGINVIRELDTALTEMRKVSDESLSSLKNFQVESFDIASAVGTTAKQIQNSTADWMRLGESLEEASDSASVSNILLNVSEFENIDAATESLVAMSAAYNELDKIEIVDKLNLVGNNFAISTDGLATALQKSASALKTAGNDMDEAIALVTAGNQVVQDPDSVGAGLRTIALRITGTEAAKEELEKLGEDTSDFMVQTSAKSQEAIKNFTKVASNNFQGFNILDDNGNFKSTYEILLGISEIYDEIVATDKQYGSNMANGLLETLAGKNRANIAASIIQNPQILKDAYESSAYDSEGSAQEELDKYLDSIEGKIAQFQNELQEFWYNFISSETIKTVIDAGTKLLDILGDVVGYLGEIGTLAATITGYFGFKSIAKNSGGRVKKFTLVIKYATESFSREVCEFWCISE